MDRSMRPTSHADDPRPRPVHPPMSSHHDQPTVFAPAPAMEPRARLQSTRPAVPPAPHTPPAPKRRHTLRQLLVGQRSIIFIGIMLARMIWLLVQGVRSGSD